MEDDGYMEIPVVDLAPRGDLILIVGSEELKIRVQSLFLKTASKPFATMLDPRFVEGQLLAKASLGEPMELELPDDYGMAMMYICSVIHYKTDSIPKELGPERLLEISLMIDKYELLPALTLQAKRWCKDLLKEITKIPVKELGTTLAASRYFHDESMCLQVMELLVMEWNGSYLEVFPADLQPLITWEVIYGLEAERNRCKLEMASIMCSDGANNFPQTCNHGCRWIEDYSRTWRAHVSGHMSSISRLNLSTIMDFVSGFHVTAEHHRECTAKTELNQFGRESQRRRRQRTLQLKSELRTRLMELCWWKKPSPEGELYGVNSEAFDHLLEEI